MELSQFAILSIFCLVGSFIMRVTGFGFGIFVIPAFAYLLPSFGEATTLSGLLALTSSLVTIAQKKKFVQWKLILPILSTFLIASTICIFFVAQIEDSMLKSVLGVFLVLISAYFFWFNSKIHLKRNLGAQLSMGGLSGIMGGFFAMQGPPVVLYLLAATPNKNVYVACMQTFLCTGNIYMTAIRGYNGFLTTDVGLGYLFGIPAVFVGSFIGNKVFNKISDKVLRKCVYAYLAIAGLWIFFTA